VSIESLNAFLIARCPGLVQHWLPGGRLQGERKQEYVARNPCRADAHVGSFSINIETGAWSDFATGDRGGNLVSLVAYLRNTSIADAAKQVEDEFSIPPDRGPDGPEPDFSALLQQPPKASKKDEPALIVPVPEDAPPPPIPSNATAYWTYHTAEGGLIGYIYRVDPPGQRKQFYPCSYTEQGWRKAGFATPRPLYGLHRLAARPGARVILVEGEKAADAGGQLFPDDVVVTWPNGSSNAHLVDWTPLAGRTIVAIPDHDAPGVKAMQQIAAALASVATIQVVTVPEALPEKWDLADALAEGWTPDRARDWLNALCLAQHPGQTASEPACGVWTLPAPLQAVADWILATSARPQPVFALQGALALGSVLMGRRYRTDQNNYPSLYFVNVGPSTCGKEQVKTALEAILEAAGLEALLGPSGYTSASGVLTHLQARPTHLTIIDELGSFLRATKQANNSLKAEALTQLVECFGRLHGTVRPLGYSQQTAGKQQSMEEKRLPVIRPAITLLAMTTPGTLFDNLSINQVESGLVNRLIIAETDRGRVASQRVAWTPPPMAMLDWARQVRYSQQSGNLASELADLPCDTPAEPVIFAFSSQANRLWDDFDVRILQAMDGLDAESLAPLLGRTREKAMRLSLVLAGCTHPDQHQIGADWAEQARDYVWTQDCAAVDAYRGRVAESEFGRLYNALLDCISRGGPQGRTPREIGLYCRLFRDKKPSERTDAIQALIHDGRIREIELPTARGKARKALVCCEGSDDE